MSDFDMNIIRTMHPFKLRFFSAFVAKRILNSEYERYENYFTDLVYKEADKKSVYVSWIKYNGLFNSDDFFKGLPQRGRARWNTGTMINSIGTDINYPICLYGEEFRNVDRCILLPWYAPDLSSDYQMEQLHYELTKIDAIHRRPYPGTVAYPHNKIYLIYLGMDAQKYYEVLPDRSIVRATLHETLETIYADAYKEFRAWTKET